MSIRESDGRGPIIRTARILKGRDTSGAILERKFNRLCKLSGLSSLSFLMDVQHGKTIEYLDDHGRRKSFTPSEREQTFASKCLQPTAYNLAQRDRQEQERQAALKRIENKLSSLGCLVEIQPSESNDEGEDNDEPFAHLGIYKLPRASM